MHPGLSRRGFLKGSSAAGLLLAGCGTLPKAVSSKIKDRLRIGMVGVSGRGGSNLNGVAGETIAALCDVDSRALTSAGQRFPQARLYSDFRAMMDPDLLDAVVVSTPDHSHALPTKLALEAGLDVYCEKPLTRTVAEARRVTELAAKTGAVTQMGIQIHSEPNYRRVVELVQSGTLGSVREVHVFCAKNWSADRLPQGSQLLPDHLDWDLWLGGAPTRPYHSEYLPGKWRRYWDFGSGTMGDMACHYMDLPFWALGLQFPQTVEAEGPPVRPGSAPDWLTVHYAFGPRGDQPPVRLTWSDGGARPSVLAELGLDDWSDGVLFIGDRGSLVSNYTDYLLLPEEKFADFEPPEPSIPDSIGHYAEWISACKTREGTSCDFSYAGPLTESVLLGVVAYRTGRRLDWKADSLQAIGNPEADGLIHRAYRPGWEV